MEGRADDVLRYGNVDVHPHLVRSVLLQAPAVVEYQVRQTPDGVDVDIVAVGDVDGDELAGALRRGLGRAGLRSPRATVRRVDAIARHPETGKLRRFIPLAPPDGGQETKRTS